MIAKKGDKGNKGDTGTTPTIQAGTATSLDATASPTVTSTTIGTTTTFNFGIPKGDISKIETPTFTDTVDTYTTLSAANTAAETASNAIKSKVNILTILSNAKKSFSAIVQGLKILATNVGAINGITSDINSESTTIAASSKMVHDLNASLNQKMSTCYPQNKIYAIQAQYEADANGTITIVFERPLKDQWYMVFFTSVDLLNNAVVTEKTKTGCKVTYAPWANLKPWVSILCVCQW